MATKKQSKPSGAKELDARAVITVPAWVSDEQRQRIKEGAKVLFSGISKDNAGIIVLGEDVKGKKPK